MPSLENKRVAFLATDMVKQVAEQLASTPVAP